MGCDEIVIDMHAGFSGKTMFWRMGCDIYIYCDEWNCCLYLICVVWRPGECKSQAWKKYICAECNLLLMSLLRILIDMWWYWFEMTLLIKIMSTWINVIVDDYVNMKWGCCCCW